MLDALPSGIGPSSQLRAAIAALSAHLAIVVAAVYGTAHQIVTPAVTRRDTVRIQLPTMPTGEGTERAGSVPTAAPLPNAPPLPVLPLDQPTPTMSLTVAADASALAALREAAVRDVGTLGAASEGTTPLPVSALDELPAVLNDLRPRYPKELRAATVNGEVVVEYVIDRNGRVLANSIRTIRSGHPAFTRSVREALLSARFRPGRRGGRSVAVLVRQRIRFKTDRSS
jgi:periplasmic protein TonB